MEPEPLKFVVMYAPADQNVAAWIRQTLQDLGCYARLLPYTGSPAHSVQPQEYVLLVLSKHSGDLPLAVDPFAATRIPVTIDDTPMPKALVLIAGIYLHRPDSDEGRRRLIAEAIAGMLRPRQESFRPPRGRPPFPRS